MTKILATIIFITITVGVCAKEIIPMGVELPVIITNINAQKINVKVTETKIQNTTWDQIAKNLNGCIVEGMKQPSLKGRQLIQFDKLQCDGKPVIKIQAIAVSSNDKKVGLPNNVDVGTTFTILLLDNAI